MSFDIKKFFSGFNIFDGEKLGKIIFYGILIVLGLVIYNHLTRPTTIVRVEKGGQSTIIQNKQKNWGIGGNVQSDKTIGFSIMYFF